MIALLSELTARHLAKNPLRAAVVTLVLALGAALYLQVVAASARTVGEFERFVHRTSGRIELSIEAPGIGLLRDSVESVREVPGVAHAAARVQIPVPATDLGESLLLIGVDHPEDEGFSSFETPEGGAWLPRPARDTGNERASVFLSDRFASRHGLALGSLLRLQAATGPREFIVRGLLSDSGPAAAFDGHFAVTFLDSLQAEFGRGHFIDRIDVGLAPGADRELVETSLRDLLGQGVAIGAAERRGVRLRALVEPLRGSLRLSGFLGMLGVLASLLAVLLGKAPASDGASLARRPSASSGAVPTPVPVLRMTVLGVVLLLAACVPVRSAYWLAAIVLAATVAGVVLLTPALVVAACRTFASAAGILAVPPRFGRDRIGRTLGRGTVNLFALLVALGTAVCVVGWLSSFERSITRWADAVGLEDLTVTRGSPLFDQHQVVFAGSVARAVEQIPGVGRVQSHRRFEQGVDNRVIVLSATDTSVFIDEAALRGKTWPLLRGAPLKRDELENGPEILLSAGAARTLAKEIGDPVTIHSPRGDVPFIVRGITEGDSTSLAGFIDRRHLLSYWADETVDRISVYVAAGHSPQRVAADIAGALGSDGSLFVTATSTLRAGLAGSLRPVFEQARSVQLATLGLALLAIVATLAAPHLRSRKEAPATPVAPRRLGAARGATLGLCVVLVASALGVLVRALVVRAILGADSGWHFDFQFPWQPLAPIGLAVIGLFAVAAAVTPGDGVAPSE